MLSAIARKVGVTSNHITSIAAGRRRASVELAERIQEATGGEVKAPELVFWKAEADQRVS